MALVEIVASNLHAGANLAKLEVGSVVEVDDATGKRWIDSGKAKETDKKKGVKLTSFEVATPSGDTSAIQSKLDEALAQIKTLTEESAAKDEQLSAATARAETAESALTEATKGK